MKDKIYFSKDYKNKNLSWNFTREEFNRISADSAENPAEYWQQEGKIIDWIKDYTRVKNTSFTPGEVSIQWFEDGELNVCYNCVDRHAQTTPNKVALILEGDEPENSYSVSYAELLHKVSKLANVYKKLGITKGDRVGIYMPMVPEALYAMLACARIGAVHSVIFGGFSPEALAGRIADSGIKLVVTANFGVRGSKLIPLKDNVDKSIEKLSGKCPVENVLVYNHIPDEQVGMTSKRDVWYHEIEQEVDEVCECVAVSAEDPLFILYTSGSTGTPKGLMHTSGGYLVYAASSFRRVFDYKANDVFWCTADVGWITGHTYVTYGALANGATSLVFEGIPSYPSFSRIGEVVEKHKVSILYTAPTAIRALMKQGDDLFTHCDLSSLRLLGSVGEPINPESWEWYHRFVGQDECYIVDTWWQTETGGILISPIPGMVDLKPGSASLPLFGVKPAIVDNEGKILEGVCEGNLVMTDSWPGQARTIWGNHQRFEETYFTTYPHYYFTGDGARRDEDGYYIITGRVDDVLNVSGHRLGTAEIESALVEHTSVAESATIGFQHEIKGQGIYCFVILKEGATESSDLEKALKTKVREIIGPIATPDQIQFVPDLPKTRSGKIMRRILRKITENAFSEIGDTSTLANPEVVEKIIDGYKTRFSL